MRRILGIVLILVGAFGIALAVILPTVAIPAAKKTPLDLNITLHSTGKATLLDAATGKTQSVQLRATRIVRTDSHASDSTNTTVNETLCIVIVQGNTPDCVRSTDPRLLSITTDRVTADRKSAEAVHVAKYGENINGDTAVRHTGMSYKWPIDAQKKTYQFYAPDLAKAFPAVYKGESTIKGKTVYRYDSSTGKQPYKILGSVDGFYTDDRTVYVDPTTGAIINGVEHQVQTLKDGGVALDTTLSFEPSAINYQTNYAQTKKDQLKQGQVYLPIIAGVLGVVALIGGIVLLRSGRRRGDGGGAHRDEVPPPDPATDQDDGWLVGGRSSQT